MRRSSRLPNCRPCRRLRSSRRLGPRQPPLRRRCHSTNPRSILLSSSHRSSARSIARPNRGRRRLLKSGKDQVLCIIEAMKLMNEITSEYDGELVSAYVENGKPVQYGERLFAIKTS
jgi:hypothetical protein